jgi:hypothetical protein
MRKIIGTVLVAAAVIATASAIAAPKSFKIGLRLADGSYCASQLGSYKYTPVADSTVFGLQYSPWASDTNGYDPDCMHLDLQTDSATLTADFRVCLRFADSAVLDSRGNIDRLSQYGTHQCTPWASDGGGWSKPATDANGYDWDAAQLITETRAMPASAMAVTDYRIGGRLCDDGCSGKYGTTQYTPWASAGGGKSAWFGDSNWYDSDGGQLILEVNKSITGCKEAVPLTEQAKLTTTGSGSKTGLGNAGAPNGELLAPAGSVITSLTLKNGFNDRMIESVTWTGTENILTSPTTASALRVPSAGNKQIVTCPENYAVVGLDLYRGGGDNYEKGLFCKPIIAGTVNRALQKEYSINGCGQAYCAPYYNFPTTGVVMIGGRFNTDDHKYLGSIVVAPITPITERPITCPTVPPETQPAPAQDGDINVTRFGGPFNLTSPVPVFGNPISGTEAWIDNATPLASAKQSANPAIFLKLAAQSTHAVYVTDLPGKKEMVSYASCTRGTTCTTWGTPTLIPPANCNGTSCLVNSAVPVAPNVVTHIAIAHVDDTVTNPPPASTTSPGTNPITTPAATCTLTATPSTIVINVGSSKLEWTCTNGSVAKIQDDNAALNDIGDKPLTGSVTVSPDKTTTFTVTAGGASATATVVVGGSVIDETGGL